MRTVLEHLIAAGISAERARTFLAQGWVRVDGYVIKDPHFPLPDGAKVVLVK
jgi:ribosomal protein S4